VNSLASKLESVDLGNGIHLKKNSCFTILSQTILDDLTADELLDLLSPYQRKEFESQLRDGLLDVILIPWWIELEDQLKDSDRLSDISCSSSSSGIVGKDDPKNVVAPWPSLHSSIPSFHDVSRLPPKPGLVNNLVEILLVYVIIWRHWNGDFTESDGEMQSEALLLLSRVLGASDPFVYQNSMEAVASVRCASLSVSSYFKKW
jgi:hypothetical protein